MATLATLSKSSSRHSATKVRQTSRMASPLSLRKSAMVLKSGARCPDGMQDDEEYWSVPAGTLDGFKNLMTLIRQFDEEIDNVNLDEATATKFISRYYRMRSDAFTRASSLQVEVIPHKFHSAEQRSSLARVEKARKKYNRYKTTGITDPAE